MKVSSLLLSWQRPLKNRKKEVRLIKLTQFPFILVTRRSMVALLIGYGSSLSTYRRIRPMFQNTYTGITFFQISKKLTFYAFLNYVSKSRKKSLA